MSLIDDDDDDKFFPTPQMKIYIFKYIFLIILSGKKLKYGFNE